MSTTREGEFGRIIGSYDNPTFAPTTENGGLITSTDTDIIRKSLRVYGSIYLTFLILFCLLRPQYPKLFNLRSWVAEQKCELAQTQTYGVISWAWKVFKVTDDVLLDQCGMDALCFLRSLRVGAKLTLFGSLNSLYLMPLFYTAEDSPETEYLNDNFVLLSVANLPISSKRFAGPVLAAYLISFYSIWLITKEYDWYIEYRHKYLSQRQPRNYAIYVSGIPKEYRSSYALADYFQRTTNAVLVAHIAMDIPSLESKVVKREKLIQDLEHALALEQLKGVIQMHRTGSLRKVLSVETYQAELVVLNKEIALRIGKVLNFNHRLRRHLKRCDHIGGLSGNGLDSPLRDTERPSDNSDLNADDDGSFSGDGSWKTSRSESLTGRSSTQTNDGSTMTLGNSVMTLGILKPIPEAGSPPRLDVPRLEDAVGTLEQELRINVSDLQRTIGYEKQLTGLASSESSTIQPTNDSLRHDFNDALRLDNDDSLGVREEWTSSMMAEFSHLFEKGESKGEMQLHRKEETVSEFLGIKGRGGHQQQGTDQSIEIPVLDLDNGEPVHRSESPPHPFLQFLGLTSFQRTRTSSQENSLTLFPTSNSTEEPELYHDDHGDHDDRSKISTLEDERSSSLSPMLAKPVLYRDVTVPRSNLEIQRGSDDFEKGETSRDENCQNPTGPEYIDSGIDLAIAPKQLLSKLQSSTRSDGMLSSYSGSSRTVDTNDGVSSTGRRKRWSRKAKDKSSRSDGQLSGSSEPSRQSSSRSMDTTGSAGFSSGNRRRWSKAMQGQSLLLLDAGSAMNKRLETGSRAVADNVSESVRKARHMSAVGVKKAKEFGAQHGHYAPEFGAMLAASASAFAPSILRALGDGQPREAGFVIFKDLYTTNAARQMIQHSKAFKMQVEAAPNPNEIFWRNVGLPSKARKTGRLISMAATVTLCLCWSIPMAFLSSLTEVNSLKKKLPALGDAIEQNPWLENFLALIAPLLVLFLNETVLPTILKWFTTWEGHIASPALDVAVFGKLSAFTIIQTFFISAVSGTISAELTNILDNPNKVVDLLANSLPAQSSYMLQIIFVSTFVLQGLDLLRVYPLTLALIRRCVGPNLTAKERGKSYGLISSLEDPPEFCHAEITAQFILFHVVFFVYSTIAPVTSLFIFACFVICETGYRYHFIHNYKTTPDSGGKLWKGFIRVLLVSMLIGQFTLVGLLVLKKTVYAVPAIAPLITMTILYMAFVIPKKSHVSNYLPTMSCVEVDEEDAGPLLKAAKHIYLQPALQHPKLGPNGLDNVSIQVPAFQKKSRVDKIG